MPVEKPKGIITVKFADATAFAEKLPHLHAIFNQMAQMPLTGRPVYDTLIDPLKTFYIREAPAGTTNAAGGYFPSTQTLKIETGVSPATARSLSVHEGFHALQDMHDKANIMWEYKTLLPKSDMMALHNFAEAAAIAYTYIYHKEADDYAPGTWQAYRTGRDPEILRIFDETYAAAEKKFTDKAKRLEYTGRVVVEALLAGKSPGWAKFYFNKHEGWIGKLSLPAVRDAKHDAMVRETLAAMGKVSDKIDLTPKSVIKALNLN